MPYFTPSFYHILFFHFSYILILNTRKEKY
nr:MAG TPA: hypothetical protein [Caudoviricetes sp.]